MPATKIIATAMMMALPIVACAKDYALTVYGGYRGGGNFTDANTDQSLGLESSGAVSLALDIPLDTSRQYQFFVSHQHTKLALDVTSPGSNDKLAMDVTYFHFGGSNFFDGPVGKGPYLVGGIGATLFSPGPGYSNEIYPSINLGIGYQWPVGDTLALRFEARGYGTLINSSGGLFCSGGCTVSIRGDGITQGEVMLGLSTRF